MIRAFITLVRTLFVYVVIAAAVVVAAVPALLIALLPASLRYTNRFYYWMCDCIYRSVIGATFLSVTYEGREHIPDEPAIFVANHQSSLDIPLLGSLVAGAPHVWLFYVRYAKIPVIGFLLKRMNVVIDPRGLRRLVRSLDKTLEIIQDKKTHVMIFPEGGRYVDGTIHKFFYGFAVLAKDSKRPVIPVMLHNVGKAYGPGAFFFRRAPIKIVIGKPYYFQNNETEDAFVECVHAWFRKQNNH